MAKLIPLTQGQFAIVDDGDFEWLSQYKWFARWAPSSNAYYVTMNVPNPKKPGHRTTRQMHGMITGAPLTDHKNRNTLDNRRENLRPCTASENQINRVTKNRNFPKGVSKAPHWKRYQAVVTARGVRYYLGSFLTVKEAADAYDKGAFDHFGEFAVLNNYTGED